MKEKFLNKSIQFLKKYQNYSDEEIEKLRYGLEGLYLTFTKLVILLILSFILGIFKELILLLIFYNIIRYTGFGFHANKSWQCLLISTTFFIIFPLIMMNLSLSKVAYIIISLICIINFILFAPADTIKRPLPNKKKRIIRKISTVLIGIIYSILCIIYIKSWWSPIMLTSLIIEAITVNPLIYIIFHQPFNNYKTYKPD